MSDRLDVDSPQTPLLQAIPRSEHTISRRLISPRALKVLYRLHEAGFRACLVGGGVRDLLLGLEPKDFDVATDAHPEEVRRLFRNCRLIGRRFRLAHIHFGNEIIEVATFRAQQDPDDDKVGVELNEHGRIVSDNVFGSIEDDALRRDFTINALYYDIADFSVRDYASGMADLQAGVLRLIGDPEQRYREDPVRMLRAVRFMAKLGFRLAPETEAPIHQLGHLLLQAPPARLFDELLKLFMSGQAVQCFELLRLFGLFRYLFPATDRCLRNEHYSIPRNLLIHAFTNTDQRIAEGRPITPAFLYATLLWGPLQSLLQQPTFQAMPRGEALQDACDELIRHQNRHTALPRRYALPMREIWALQNRFERRTGKRALAFMQHPRFRAAYDFLLLRAAAGEPVTELAEWWTMIQQLDDSARRQALAINATQPRQAKVAANS
jgi:poly(A) polymerase